MVTQNQTQLKLSLDYILTTHRNRSASYQRYISYYDGNHDLSFATNKWRNAFGNLFRQFADNLCAPIIDAAADRLQVTGFTGVPNDIPLWDIWKRNKMDRKAGTIHEHVLKTGDAYAIVWPDPLTGLAVISPNPAFQVCVYYADDGETIIAGSKLWQADDQRWRLTIYYADRLEKYATLSPKKTVPDKANDFRPFNVPGEPWPVPNPYAKVPVFHFANKPEMGVWGESELSNIIPIQNALNKSVSDMLIAMEFVSLPQRWATGLEIPEDPITGAPKVPFEAGVDRIWSSPEETTRFGQFEGANLQQFTQVQNDLRLDMARISRTPLHYLSMGGSSQSAFVSVAYPSGESLKTAEAPFVAKLEDRQIAYGDVWEDLIAFAALIDGTIIDSMALETVWQSAAPKSETDNLANSVQKKALGIPDTVIWKELGYNDEEIAAMTAMNATNNITPNNNAAPEPIGSAASTPPVLTRVR